MKVLGCDPGLAGAVALLTTRATMLEVFDMPVIVTAKRKRIAEDILAEQIARFAPDIAWLELVSARPGQGVASMFNFGTSYGLLIGVLAGLQIPREFVSPVQWKRAFGLGADKAAARHKACQLFPAQAATLFARVKDDGRAEAALLALYGMRRSNGASPSLGPAHSSTEATPAWLA